MTNVRRYGGFFLIAALAVQGIPIGGGLSVSVHPGLDEARDLLLSDIQGIGSGQSRLRLLFWLLLYTGSVSLLLFRLPQSSLRILRDNVPLVLLTLLVPLSLLWTSNPRIVATNAAHGIGVMAIAVAAAISYRDRPLVLVRHMSLILGLNVLIHLASIVVLPEYSINWEGRWRGLWNHPNNFGRIALCTLAVNVSYLALARRRKTWLHVMFIAASIIALIGTQSKTSTVCAIPAIAGPYFLAWVYRNYGQRGAWQMVLLFGLLAATFGLPVIFFAQEILEAVTGLVGRDASFTGRTDIWAAAISAIGEKPITGWSFDSHLEVLSATSLRFNNYHNGYLDIMVSGGIVALVLFSWLMIRFFISMKDSEPAMIVMFLPLAVAILIHNIFEAGLLTGRGTIWIMLIVVVLLQSAVKTAAYKSRQKDVVHNVVRQPGY